MDMGFKLVTSASLGVVNSRLSYHLGTKFQKLSWSTLSIFKTLEEKQKVAQLQRDKI
jgi:hypothetical protein